MNIAAQTRYGPVEAITLGYGPLGPPLMSVSMFYVDELLIDTCQRRMQPAALKLLAGKKIAQVLLTHHHEDHSGNAAAIRRMSGAEVLGHPLTAEKMRGGFPIRLYQKLVWGPAPRMEITSLGPAVETERYRLLPVHTPGHSRDHTVFLEPSQGWLFAGDLFLGERIKFFRADECFGDQIASLRKVLAFDFEALLCAHNPTATGGKARLKRKLDFMEDLYGEIGRLRGRGIGTRAIIRTLDPRRDRRVKFITCGNASFANMVRSACRDGSPSGPADA
jgi:glyoxylase-like metal-dependent hydrolase (beta-lactamase superfamily II)